MLILILGNTLLSRALAAELTAEGHDIILITEQKQHPALTALDIKIVYGTPSHPDALRHAHAGEADVLLAITSNDEMNMVACQVAHSLFQVPKKIA